MTEPEQDPGLLDPCPVCFIFKEMHPLGRRQAFRFYENHKDDTDFHNSISVINCPYKLPESGT